MSAPRLVLITRRFWPLVGGAETMMSRLAATFQSMDVSTTVLTAQWRSDWPCEVEHRGVRVIRLPQPEIRGYGTWRYMRGLSRWLTRHRAEFDLVYVSMLKHDAYVAVGCGRRLGFPVVLRAEGAGQNFDCQWQKQARFGRIIRRRCQQADALVAISPLVREELTAHGYRADRIYDITNGVSVPSVRTESARAAARRSLAEVQPGLLLPPRGKLAVYTGRLAEVKGLRYLVEAWQKVVHRWPDSRLWLVGDGPDRDRLEAQIEQLGLEGQVILPGAFDDVEDVLLAADFFVLPSLEEGVSVSLLEAMAAGLPVIATSIAGNRYVAEDRVQALLVPPRDPASLAAAFDSLIERPEYAAELAAAGRNRVISHFTLQKTAQSHLELFQKLLGGSR